MGSASTPRHRYVGRPPPWADKLAIQGNLDPIALIAGGRALDEAVDRILADTAGAPFVFNLGHGVLPETPPDHVAQVVARVRGHA